MTMSTLIRVPATSANLGPGFDCLGLALDLWNEIKVDVAGDQLQIIVEGEGKSSIPTDETNAIYQAMQSYAKRHHKVLPTGIFLHCFNRIPLGSGLGSSAAAVVGGILAAGSVLGLAENKATQLEAAAIIEGHPDNVAPCLMGGLVAAFMDEGQVVARNLEVAPLSMILVVPDFQLLTKSSRAVLPVQFSRQDAVFNLSRVVLLTDALAEGDLDLLSLVMQDRIHQPYRIPLIPGAAAVIDAAKKAGAAAVVLSGAGPSLLAVLHSESDRQIVGKAMLGGFSQAGLKARIFTPEIALLGASITAI